MFAVLFSSLLWAASLPPVCERTDDTAIEMLQEPHHRLDFGNQGGLIDGGVCWWHSRFERAAAYVAQFKPSRRKPSASEAKSICRKISRMQFVSIPGYANLNEFSHDYEDVIQNELNQWQIRDGFLNHAWVNGLSGTSHMEPGQLAIHMNKIVQKFRSHPYPMFLRLQIKGITSHAFVLVGVENITNGYALKVTDSNTPRHVVTQTYHKGTSALDDFGTEFVPYMDYNKDLKQILSNKKNYCKLAQRSRR